MNLGLTIFGAQAPGSTFVNFLLEHCSDEQVVDSESWIMAIYKALYFPVLISCAIATAGYVIHWVMNGGDIDLGPPNARVGKPGH